jgi:hypothetical protein
MSNLEGLSGEAGIGPIMELSILLAKVGENQLADQA